MQARRLTQNAAPACSAGIGKCCYQGFPVILIDRVGNNGIALLSATAVRGRFFCLALEKRLLQSICRQVGWALLYLITLKVMHCGVFQSKKGALPSWSLNIHFYHYDCAPAVIEPSVAAFLLRTSIIVSACSRSYKPIWISKCHRFRGGDHVVLEKLGLWLNLRFDRPSGRCYGLPIDENIICPDYWVNQCVEIQETERRTRSSSASWA